ncbi:MAG: diguanylate cyclase (GGDEF)-like protein [Paraglaciecola sp.]|jgi:diguanylate cyclase (GGDEF)-like protein
MKLKQFVLDYLQTGCNSTNEPDTNQQILVANLFGFIGYSVCLMMGVSAFLRGDSLLGSAVLIAGFLFFSSHLILKYSHGKRGFSLSTNLITLSLVILMLILIYTGAYRNTGPLWIYVVPSVILFFGGIKKGLRNLAIFVLIASLLLFYPDDQLLQATYSHAFKTRLMYSFLTVSAMFTFYEYARKRSYADLQILIQKFEQQARRDPLSGLQNRRGMLEKLAYEHERSKRNYLPMTLMMCDIDHFKAVNDDFGHDTGDYIIKELATLFITTIRKQDTVARWGGEEFLFLLPQTSEHKAYILAEKLRNAIASTAFVDQQKKLKLTVSIGLCEIKPGETINQAISSADAYLYQAKKTGRNRTVMSA